jgi:hypothetical protein
MESRKSEFLCATADRQRGVAVAGALLVWVLVASSFGLGRFGSGDTSPRSALKEAAAHSDPAWGVALKLDQEQLRTGRDALALTVTTLRPGHLLLFQAGTDGKSLELIFPNDLDKDSAIAAGETRLPRPHWRLKAVGPSGAGALLVVVIPVAPDLAALAAALAAGRLPELAVNYGAALARYHEMDD